MGEVKKMEVVTNSGGDQEKKISYDQLKTAADQLHQQNQFLIKEIQKKGTEELYKRIEYLFKVLEFSSKFNKDFVLKASEELEAILTIPEQTEETK